MLMCLHPPVTQLVGQLWGRLNPEEKHGWVQRAIRARSARATATATAAASGQPVRRHHSPLISLHCVVLRAASPCQHPAVAAAAAAATLPVPRCCCAALASLSGGLFRVWAESCEHCCKCGFRLLQHMLY